jgi:hypothetical protein
LFHRIYNNLSWAFILLVTAICLGIIGYIVFVTTPGFLSQIKTGLVSNEQLMQVIGGEQGYELYYSGDAPTEKRFRVTVHGACDSAYVRVQGFYQGDQYTVTDTLVVACAQVQSSN